jgi:hypothetical protein
MSTLSIVADAATRDADATNTKEDHKRAQHAHEKAAVYADTVGNDKLARKHTKRAKEHARAAKEAPSDSASSDSGDPLNAWAKKRSGT